MEINFIKWDAHGKERETKKVTVHQNKNLHYSNY